MKATILGTVAALSCSLALGTIGCVAPVDENVDSIASAIVDNDEAAYIAGMTEDEKAGTLAFVNAVDTTEERLDVACGLHSDAAKHITHSKDKNGLYTSVQAIADTKQVGVYNLDQIVGCAEDFGFVVSTLAPLDVSMVVVDGTAICLVYEMEISGEPGYEVSWSFALFDFQRTGTALINEQGYGYDTFCAPYDLDYFGGQYTTTLTYVD